MWPSHLRPVTSNGELDNKWASLRVQYMSFSIVTSNPGVTKGKLSLSEETEEDLLSQTTFFFFPANCADFDKMLIARMKSRPSLFELRFPERMYDELFSDRRTPSTF